MEVKHKQIGFGIVGTGMIAGYHAQAIEAVEGVRLVAVAGRSLEKAQRFAGRMSEEVSAYGNLDAFLKHGGLDVVCVCTPSGAHLEPAVLAARRGKHLIVEKPLEVDLGRVDALLGEVARSGVRMTAIFQSRFGAGAIELKEAIAEGRFGRLVSCSMDLKWHRAKAYYEDSWHGTQALDGGGALINQGIHGIDLLQWMVGLPKQVRAWKTRRVHEGIEVEDTLCAAFELPCGALGTIQATTANFPGWERRIEICGELGSARLEEDRITYWNVKGESEDAVQVEAPGQVSGASDPGGISLEGHASQIADMVAALREGRDVRIPGIEGRRAVAFVRALYESAERGATVQLESLGSLQKPRNAFPAV